ncbi:hypothetical protein HELRODRAFT_160156 [Helobdella robusta]|uniref:Uncharacterized protein n=1 Tax=Helobdella robusta TaxID=6412 RepID=T1EPW6_HELRO|nr:hypothetical protein HELRODRAFT_160156 [Helobdella robusta]ESO06041.1 hypothetical protein HELRODRAFT_160156 [Helobdella robusta]
MANPNPKGLAIRLWQVADRASESEDFGLKLCEKCHTENSSFFVNLGDSMKDSQKFRDEFAEVNSKLNVLRDMMEEIQMKEAQINVQLEDLKRLSNEVETIKQSSSSEFAEVEHVKKWCDLFAKKVDLMANDIKSVASSVASTDSKINIFNEKNARKNNIIVFNLVENSHFSKAKDKEIMSGLFKALLPGTDISKDIRLI